MIIDLHDQPALIDAVTVGAERPVAFLVGSPLSWDKNGGVPGVDEMLNVARSLVKLKIARRLPDFERAVQGLTGAEAYQSCMKWLHGSLTQSGVNEVIRQAVLQARLRSSLSNFSGDGDPSEWYLPAGTRGLAALIASGGDRYIGPILTTNFDPLIGLSIRDAGLRRRLRVIDTDGNLPLGVEADPGEIDIVHLHGYWKGANTLHTPAQLVSARPKLTASLRRLLQQRTLVVIAYSGWDDVFTRSLIDVLQDPEAQVTVLWCFRETDPSIVATRYADFLSRAQAAITSGTIHLYGGVDCHSVFAEMTKTKSALINSIVDKPQISPLPGWQLISPSYLASLKPLKPAEALRYFDGASPTWRHIASDVVPILSTFEDIKITWDIPSDHQCTVQLINAAGGEGKSTLLMQAAMQAARSNKWEVLYRPSSQLGLSAEVVVGLDIEKRWLLVIDDADNIVNSIQECLELLHRTSRGNVDFLLAARHADWRGARGESISWASLCMRHPDVILRGLNDERDARAIVDAWSTLGEQGLRGLAVHEDIEKMTTALCQSVEANQDVRSEGSLLGGLLDVRFSPQSLRDHVRELMEKLADQPIRESGYTLQDALIYISACHSAGIRGIDGAVLSDLLGIPRAWINSRVVIPLGDEAVGSASGGCVFTRHRKVADAVLAVAESNLFVDLGEVWATLIQQTAKTNETTSVMNFTDIMHIAPRLVNSLSESLSEVRCFEIALMAARTASIAQPNRLDQITDIGRTYRAGEKFADGANVFREAVLGLENKDDYLENIRGYWYEWSVCEGLSGKERLYALRNIWLGSLALSDALNPASITPIDVVISCAGLGVAFGRMAEPKHGCPFARGRRATIWIGRLVRPGKRSRRYFDIQEAEANQQLTPSPSNLAEAVEWFRHGALAAAALLTDDEITQLIAAVDIHFEHLTATLRPRVA